MKKSINRRQFIFTCGASGVAALGAQVMVGSAALAADMPPVDVSDPTAIALGYVADGTTADKEKSPRYAAGQDCANCQLYQGTADSDAGGCPLFPGKSVAARGWCASWVQKPA